MTATRFIEELTKSDETNSVDETASPSDSVGGRGDELRMASDGVSLAPL